MGATWIYVAAAVALDGGAALVAGVIPERWLRRARGPLLGFAAGVLLGTTFLDLLPEAVGQLSAGSALAIALGGSAKTASISERVAGYAPQPRWPHDGLREIRHPSAGPVAALQTVMNGMCLARVGGMTIYPMRVLGVK
jgi:hypothetical protein